MKLGEVANEAALRYGRPLDGVRVLALEQMQALPYATQLFARLGADVVKIEHPQGGDIGRGSLPGMLDPEGRNVGATFLRNNLNKRSVCIDLKQPEGRDLVLRLVSRFDVFAENFKGGSLRRMGLGYEAVSAHHPGVVYLSVSGFGNTVQTPYDGWPAYAAVAEAMSGIYEWKREPERPPVAAPVGALGDMGTALFGVIGVLAALRQRDATGEGQYVDIAMFDAMVSMADVVTNYWSLGERAPSSGLKMILDGFPAADGWFIVQVGREHEFERFAHAVGHAEWLADPRLATRAGWREHMDAVIRPGVAAWAASKTSVEACHALSAAGVAAGPCLSAPQVIADPHVRDRHMLVEMPRADGVEEPVLTPGNPIKMSKVAEGPESRVPWLGEHTDEVLQLELGLSDGELARLRGAGVIA